MSDDPAPRSTVRQSPVVTARLSAPRPPETPRAAAFPVLAAAAPVVGALALWAVTRSSFILMFAVLGPVIAVAGFLDARRSRRAEARRERSRYETERSEFLRRLGEEHERERAALVAAHPGAAEIVGDEVPLDALWRSAPSELRIVLGRGDTASGVAVDGRLDDELAARSSTLAAAPLLVRPERGIAVRGDRMLALAVVRALALQIAHAVHPLDLVIEFVGGGEDRGEGGGRRAEDGGPWRWLGAVPHASPVPHGGLVPHGGPVPQGDDGRATLTVIDAALAGRPSRRQDAGGPRSGDRPSGAASGVPGGLSSGVSGGLPGGAPGGALGRGGRAREFVIVLVAPGSSIPPRCRCVIEVEAAGTARVTGRTAPGVTERCVVELLGAAEAETVAERLAAAAPARRAALTQLPPSVSLVDLAGGEVELDGHGAARPQPGSSLACAIGVGAHGAVVVDLVRQGPHAVVGGMTGSGKSELLVAWVIGLATRYEAGEVTVLLVDFKGGATFVPLAALPHCVGVITDLGPAESERALASLAAELRHRERLLAEHRAKDIAALPPGALPRLVIVVDECAHLLESSPALHALFADIAARGRSLGVHLVLCTQRPAAIVRDGVLANTGLRLSLRVNNPLDSTAVLGVADAAALPATVPGRCLVAAGGEVTPLQIAVASAHELDLLVAAIGSRSPSPRTRARAAPVTAPRRPWLDPLPSELHLGEVAALVVPDPTPVAGAPAEPGPGPGRGPGLCPGAPRLVLGLVDRPEVPSREPLSFDPRDDGTVLLLGAAGSGRTAAIAAVEAQAGPTTAVFRLGPDLEAAWDAVRLAAAGDVSALLGRSAPSLEAVAGGGAVASTDGRTDGAAGAGADGLPAVVLAIDDLDELCAGYEGDHHRAFLDALGSVLRKGRRHGIGVIASTHRTSDGLGSLVPLFRGLVRLRASSVQEHTLLGGDSASFDATAPPGAGRCGRARVQLVTASPRVTTAKRPPSTTVTLRLDEVSAVIGSRPAAVLDRLGDRAVPLEPGSAAAAAPASTRAPGPAGAARHSPGPPRILVGDVDAWSASWAALAAARTRGGVVLDGLSAVELRTLVRVRTLAPYTHPGSGSVLLLRRDGTLVRARWPAEDVGGDVAAHPESVGAGAPGR